MVHRSEDVPFAREFLIIIDPAPSGDGTKVTQTVRARGASGPAVTIALSAGLGRFSVDGPAGCLASLAVASPQTRPVGSAGHCSFRDPWHWAEPVSEKLAHAGAPLTIGAGADW
jgi:hypothetical protein